MPDIPSWIPNAIVTILIVVIGALIKKLNGLEKAGNLIKNEYIEIKTNVDFLMKVFHEHLLAIKHSPHTPEIDSLLDEWKSIGLHDENKVAKLIRLLRESINRNKIVEADDNATVELKIAAKESRIAAEGLLKFINTGYKITTK